MRRDGAAGGRRRRLLQGSRLGLGKLAQMAAYRLVTLVLTAGAMAQVAYLALRSGPLDSRWEYLGLETGLGLVGAATLATWRWPARRLAGQARAQAWPRRLGPAAWIVWGGLLAAFVLLVMGPVGRFFEPLLVRALAFWLLALLGAWMLAGALAERRFEARLAGTAVAWSSVHLAATYLPGISTYPLAMGWSETSRYYYASLFLSERIYGLQVPPSVLHPSRYLLQAIPFLLPGAGLWLHRLWQVLLWLGLPLLAAGLLARRLKIEGRLERGLFALWAFLFLFQGPILYHLLISLIVVLWGFDSRRFWQSLAAVALASAWAGISRINWIPVPGFLAAIIYFVERPPEAERLWRYWSRPALWISVGGLIALGSNAAYIFFSGNQPEQFGSSFTSDLLWYRLLPNRTLAPGILLAMGVVSLPMALVLWQGLGHAWRRLGATRWLPVAAMLGVLLAGGVVVSLKIGGGSNLHNLDTYLIMLLILGAYALWGRISSVTEAGRGRLSWGTDFLVVAVPVLFALSNGGPVRLPDHELGQQVIADLRGRIQALGSEEPRVLFISERHLVTFDMLEDVPLVPGYEKVFLMEMAMSGTRGYLDEFHRRLRAHEFDLIVSEPLKVQYQGRSHAFGEENDAWVREVSVPVLCHYQPVRTYDVVAVQVLAPRQGGPDCPEGLGEADRTFTAEIAESAERIKHREHSELNHSLRLRNAPR